MIVPRTRARVGVVGPSEMAADVRDVLHEEHDVVRRVWLRGADAPRDIADEVDMLLLVAEEDEIVERVPAARRATRVPLIVMTLGYGADARARALDLGADDALSAAWDDEELRARVRAVMRRLPAPESQIVCVGDLEIDLTARRVRRSGATLHLSPAEFAVLRSLARKPGAAIRREEVAREVWDDLEAVRDGRLHTAVSTLRAKIDSVPGVTLIHTIHRIGYALRR